MRRIWAVLARELRAYFDSMVAYVILVAFFLGCAFFTLQGLAASQQASLRPFFEFLPVGFLFFVPAMAMRLWSEERKLGTIEVLMTWPLRNIDLVLGKFLAGMVLIAVSLILSLTFVQYVVTHGDPDPGPIIGGYIACLLLGGAYLALSCFISSLTENQIVAFVISVFLATFFFLAGHPALLSSLPPKVPFLGAEWDITGVIFTLEKFGFGARFESIGRGVLDLGDLVFYATIMGLFLFLNVRSIAWRSLQGGSGSGGPRSYAAGLLAGYGALLAVAGHFFLAAVAFGILGAIVRSAPSANAQRWLVRFLDTLFSCILAALIAVQVGALADTFRRRIDLTEEGTYSLSRASLQVAGNLEDPLEVRCYFSGNLPPILQQRRRTVIDTLREYASATQGRMTIKILDPETDPDARERAAREGLEAQSLKIQEGSEISNLKRFFGVVLEYGDRKEIFQFMPEPQHLEAEITAALLNLEGQRATTVGFLTSQERPATGLAQLQEWVRRRRFTIKTVNASDLKAGGEVPKAINVLVVLDPEKLSERETYEIDQFIMRGGTLLLLADGVRVDNRLTAHPVVTGLEPVLARYGFTIRRELIRDEGPERQETISFNMGNPPQNITGRNPYAIRAISNKDKGFDDLDREHVCTRELPMLSFTEASPVEVHATAGTVVQLVRAGPQSSSETRLGSIGRRIKDFIEQKPWTADPRGLTRPSIAVAYTGPLSSAFQGKRPPAPEGMFEGPAADANRTTLDENKSARLVIVADAALLEPGNWGPYGNAGARALQANLTFAMNAIDWLASDEDLIALRSRGLKNRALTTSREESEFRRLAPDYTLAPLILLAFGLFRFIIGRARAKSIGAELRELAQREGFSGGRVTAAGPRGVGTAVDDSIPAQGKEAKAPLPKPEPEPEPVPETEPEPEPEPKSEQKPKPSAPPPAPSGGKKKRKK